MKNKKGKQVILVLMLCLGILLVSAGCGRSLEMTMGEPAVIEDWVEITPENVLVSTQIFPPVWCENPMGWIAGEDNKVYVAFVAKVKNLRETALTVNELWAPFSLLMKTEYSECDIVSIVTKDGTCFDDKGKIQPWQTETVYFVKEIEEIDRQEEMEAVFDFDGAPKARVVFNGKSSVACWKSLTLKKPLRVSSQSSIQVRKVHFADKADPDNMGYIYDYYAPKSEDEKLLLIETTVKNIGTQKQLITKNFDVVAFADDKEYLGDLLLEDEFTLKPVGHQVIKAKESKRLIGAMSVPKNLKLDDLEIYVYVDGTYYRYIP